MKNKSGGKSSKTNTTRRRSSPSSSSADGTGNADSSRRRRNSDSTSSSSPPNYKILIVNGRRHVRIGAKLYLVPTATDDNQSNPSDKSQVDVNPSERRYIESVFGKGGRPRESPPPGQQSHRKARARAGSSTGRRH